MNPDPSKSVRNSMPLPGRALVLACLLGLFAGGPALAQTRTGLSGHELFPGNKEGEVTKGLVFFGTDNAVCNCWTEVENGGQWTAVVDRSGDAGLGSEVTVLGGRWLWQAGNDTVRFGKLLGGSVRWPPDRVSDLGCGPGVATFAITLSVKGQATTGTFTGCLDDTHMPFVFPPKIWGTLSF